MSDEELPPDRRKDASTRAICVRLDALEVELATMRALLTGFVTFRGALLAVATILGLAGVFGAFFLSRAEAASDRAGSRALEVAAEAKALAQKAVDSGEAQERFLKTELSDFKRELKADLGDLKAEVRNAATSVRRDVKRAVVAQDGGP